jgi:hypothetical protein
MNKKISIIQKIDMTELDRIIDEYRCHTGGTNPYLFMNKNTIDAIPTVDDTLHNLYEITAMVNGLIGYYCGYKIFRDDTLDFGEVEIR